MTYLSYRALHFGTVIIFVYQHFHSSIFSPMVLWKGEQMTNHTLWSYRTDHCALLTSLKLKQLSLSPVFAVYLSVCGWFLFHPLHPSFFSHLILSSFRPPPPSLRTTATLSLSPPAGAWLVISGGCWGSSQSCKWGSPTGWPRHSVVQVRKPATLPAKQRWER